MLDYTVRSIESFLLKVPPASSHNYYRHKGKLMPKDGALVIHYSSHNNISHILIKTLVVLGFLQENFYQGKKKKRISATQNFFV